MEFLEPLDMSANALARALSVPPNRITGLINETRNVTAETALLLAKFFGSTPEFWLNLQRSFDLRRAERDKALARKLKSITPRKAA